MVKKLLLLTASYGTGHITATKFIEKKCNEDHPDIVTRTVDYLLLRNKNKKQTIFQKLYNFSMEKPRIWDMFFSFTDNIIATKILQIVILHISYNSAKKIISDFKPDVVLSSHPYWHFIMGKYKKEVKNIPYITVVTDSTKIHNAWISPFVNHYCVIDNDTKQVISKYEIENITVTGFPVNPQLEQPIDKNKIMKELNLSENKKTILITIGLGAKEVFLRIIDYLRVKKNDFQIIVIAGKYEDIYQQLKTKEYKVKTALIGWTDRMSDFIRVSDLIICKAGGAIVSESLTAFKPVFIPVFVPGQEKGNISVINKYSMGFSESKLSKVYKLLDNIVENKVDLRVCSENIKNYVRRNAAKNIIDIIYLTMNERWK